MTKAFADPRDASYIASANQSHAAALSSDYVALGTQLDRRGINIDDVTRAVSNFKVAVPSWGVGTGGTRFGRFPGTGEPRNVFEKLEDCAVIHKLTGATPTVSLHIPWDKTDDYVGLREHGAALGLGFDAMNSNTFQDQVGQPLSYKYGSLTHTDAAVRAQAVAHNIDCIKAGVLLGSRALTVWIGDVAN
ncbi:MAG: sugar isomerase, partial [Peristeroidobacter soli]